MDAWAKDQGVDQTDKGLITFMGDPNGVATKALKVVMTHKGPKEKLGPGRCKRFAMYVEDCEIKVFEVSERKDDPAGDDYPEASCAPSMLKAITLVKGDGEGEDTKEKASKEAEA